MTLKQEMACVMMMWDETKDKPSQKNGIPVVAQVLMTNTILQILDLDGSHFKLKTHKDNSFHHSAHLLRK